MDCRACIVSCQLTNGVPPLSYRNWIKEGPWEGGAGVHFQPGNCMHCDKPTCVDACPTHATYKDENDGIVKVNKRLCIGCGSCVPACPYGARYRHPQTHIVDKCDFCAGRIATGREPACVETCPTRARVFGDISDTSSKAYSLLKEKDLLRVINRKSNTDPEIYYQGKTSPLDWPVEARLPGPIQMFRDVFNPVLKGVVCLSGLGVLVMLGKQLFSDDEPHHRGHAEDIGKGVGNGSQDDQAP
jgi:Fe-S-cluster-containing dehydrogenase component